LCAGSWWASCRTWLRTSAISAPEGRLDLFRAEPYQTYLWDDVDYPVREVQGFCAKDELRCSTSLTVERLVASLRVLPTQGSVRRVGRCVALVSAAGEVVQEVTGSASAAQYAQPIREQDGGHDGQPRERGHAGPCKEPDDGWWRAPSDADAEAGGVATGDGCDRGE
jgi:hypothetical protein